MEMLAKARLFAKDSVWGLLNLQCRCQKPVRLLSSRQRVNCLGRGTHPAKSFGKRTSDDKPKHS